MDGKQKLKGTTGFEEQGTLGVSPWMLSLVDELGEESQDPHWTYTFEDFTFEIVEGRQSLWITSQFPAGGRVAMRAAYCPDGELTIDEIRQIGVDNAVEVFISSTVGPFRVEIYFPQADRPMLHFKTTLSPVAPLLIPFWPRDVIPLGKDSDVINSEGHIYAKQVGPRTGLVYFSLTKPRGGSALYFQNLTSLNEYCRLTETSLASTVGGEWPELGFALPATTEKALEAGQEIVISDAFMIFSAKVPQDDLIMAQQFLDFLTQIYLALPRMKTEYIDWLAIAKKSLRDLNDSEKCWSEVRGRHYLNAYVADYENPPESMVQLTVLLPLLEYAEWSGEEIPISKELLEGLPNFYDKKAGVVGRWLPSVADRLDGSEPQKKPEVMDSWYLYHTLLNLSRLALHGDKVAQKLFLDSMDYSIKVAQKFEYQFPVFYDLYTLEILKEETSEGQGGEHDVAGLYAHVMLQAWLLTKKERYLEEAKKAGRALKGLGFNLFYQANETLFGAGALLRLWKETGDEEFLKLSYLSLANTFNNMWLWECNYGYAEHYRTFFALFPLKDAPYTAVYEELEGFAAFHDYLLHYHGEMPEWVNILLPEFHRNMLYKASYYYPPNLPVEAMVEEPKTGEVDPKLWIPLEDIYDGWEKAGQVGQEVYGAGMPFAIIPRHYWAVPDGKFMVYVDYPIKSFSTVHDGQAMFRVLGDPRLSCRMRIIPTGRKSLPEIKVITEREDGTETLKGHETDEGHLEFTLSGDRNVIVHWEAKGSKPRSEKKSNNSNGRKGSKK
ncbi:MAG TPA: hypothetical protein VK897_14525 [Anaerolineales bacterium]|nr:hypothetical protein [Anaerolineales bacterium]